MTYVIMDRYVILLVSMMSGIQFIDLAKIFKSTVNNKIFSEAMISRAIQNKIEKTGSYKTLHGIQTSGVFFSFFCRKEYNLLNSFLKASNSSNSSTRPSESLEIFFSSSVF